MSKIRLHGSSSGYTEIAPVAASGNNTITLPDSGTIISKDSNGAVGVTSITVGTGVTIGDGRVTCSTLHGSAANCTQIPAANIVGVCTAGFERSGGFGGGTQDFDRWHLTADTSGNTDPIQNNWSRWTGYGGTGTVTFSAPSSGLWSFPSTGFWYIDWYGMFQVDNKAERGCNLYLYATTNDSSYAFVTASETSAHDSSAVTKTWSRCTYVFDVTDTSTHKIKLAVGYNQSSNTLLGHGSYLYSNVLFVKLRDT